MSPSLALSSPELEPVSKESSPTHPMPGYKAMWVGVCLEYIEFTVFFVVYFVSRWHHPVEFQQGAARLWTTGGLTVAIVMVTSGYALTRMLAAMRAGKVKVGQTWLAAALLLGLVYPVVKTLEWQWNADHGIDAKGGIFVIVYFYLTINHFIHACWGLLGMAWGLGRSLTGGYANGDIRGLESLAIYWHATDLVWLMIFALFYAFA